MSEPRFGLDCIDKQKAALDAAKKAALDKNNNRSASKLVALSNLPLLIVLLGWLLWTLWR